MVPTKFFKSRSRLSLIIALWLLLPAAFARAQAWEQLSPTSSPPASYRHSMVFDIGRNVAVLFGGLAVGVGRDDRTWEWDGTTWNNISTLNSPSKRSSAAMAYNSDSGEILLFGGSTLTGFANDTWRYDGSNWTEVVTAHAPEPRENASMVYDSDRGVFILFGGRSEVHIPHSYNYFSDTWEFDGTDWTEVNVAEPPAIYSGALVYDSARKETILFGGAASTGLTEASTYRYDGAGWSKLTVAEQPPSRAEAVIYFDTNRDVAVLYGGQGGPSPYLTDLWQWDGSNWSEATVSGTPSARKASAIAFDPIRNIALLFGGFTGSAPLGDTWELDIPALSPTPAPTPETIVTSAPTPTPSGSPTPEPSPTAVPTSTATPEGTPSQGAVTKREIRSFKANLRRLGSGNLSEMLPTVDGFIESLEVAATSEDRKGRRALLSMRRILQNLTTAIANAMNDPVHAERAYWLMKVRKLKRKARHSISSLSKVTR
ncbi:MAG: hypothetical protein J5J00_05350 [Deltaproteobacteria bacterium]|nr:hypothetical protein [Deltaproteobacteria bacterium]